MLPKAGSSTTADLPPPAPGTQRHVLAAEEELRLEVASRQADVSTQLHLRSGSAELWGLELGAGQAYTIPGGLKIALFTWHGATIDVTVSPDPSLLTSAYCSTETVANVAAVNTHAQLEALRDQAAATDDGKGPRVLIVGPREAGKTSLAKTLTAYAVKLGRTPILVDLDPSDNCMTVPGTISACAMTEACLEVASHATTGLPVAAQPLTLWHGSTEVLDRIFSAQVESLSQTIRKRCANDPNCRSSGIIVNTNTTQEQRLLEIVRTLHISILLVIGHDRLYSVLSSQTDGCTVVKLPRSGGVVSRTAAERTTAQHRSIRQYLYGTHHELTPTAVPTTNATILRVRTVALSQHLLPVAQQQTTAAIQYDTVTEQDGDTENVLPPTALVAVSTQGDVTVGIAGCGVADTNGRLLCPSAGRMPTPTVLLTAAADATTLTWME